MKTRHLIPILIVSLLAVPATAQIDSVLHSYPLNVGDVWQYYIHFDCPYPPYYLTIRVLGDTLMPNGKWYKRLDQIVDAPYTAGTTPYRRIDSASANVLGLDAYNPIEVLYDSLRASPGDTNFTAIRPVYCVRVDTSTILGVQTTIKEFNFLVAQIISTDMTFGEGFGLVKKVDLDGWNWPCGPTYTDLVYAKINGHEFGTYVSVSDHQLKVPIRFSLSQNYPNPFNPSTIFQYELPSSSAVTLEVFNVLGQKMASLVEGFEPPGVHSAQFDGSAFPSGVYIYQITAGQFIESRRMLLIK